MGQLQCCGYKTSTYSNQAKTPQGDSLFPEIAQCHPTSLFQKSEEELLNEELICSICLNVVRNAVKDPCGHVYGEGCIKSWLLKNPKCPYSQQTLDSCQLFAEKQVRLRVISEIESSRIKTPKNGKCISIQQLSIEMSS